MRIQLAPCELLQVGRHELPEDKLDIGSSSYFSRDVYLLIVSTKLLLVSLPKDEGLAYWRIRVLKFQALFMV